MFDTVLVANRGEIAVRVIRTLRAMGIRSVAVYSDADAGAPHVRAADTAVRLGPAAASESYLSVERLLEAAARAGAQAVHPGYGFLAENPAFARACAEAGLVFVGPPAEAVELMGDKIRAKETVRAAGVPVVSGSSGSGLDDAQLAAAAREIGPPVLLKPSAGGGGKGMRLVRELSGLESEIAAARRTALGAFGDGTLLVERWIEGPRHIEIQVLADGHGTVLHLGERECSLQRRHQKIIEEAPSPLLDPATRAAMGEAAVEAARSCGYRGAGTVEFIVPGGDPGAYSFMEMNTRLQVEHPVTELVVRLPGGEALDLVEWQLRVAAGEPLPWRQEDITLSGHAVEARICAETARLGAEEGGGERVDFLPAAGTVLRLREPRGPGVRTDSGLAEGTEVGTDYDPMLSKIIAHGPDRAAALRALRAALADSALLGVDTNTGFLRRLLDEPAVRAGELDTGLVDRAAAALVPREVPESVYAAAALLRQAALEPESGAGWVSPFAATSGWRLGGEPAWTLHPLRVPGHEPVTVAVRGSSRDAEVRVGAAEPVSAGLSTDAADPGEVWLRWSGVTRRFGHAMVRDGCWLGCEGDAWQVRDVDPVEAALRDAASAHGADALTAPMPGTVTVLKSAVGDAVTAGQGLLVVEAMKMEHVITAPFDGTVTELDVTVGSTVAIDQVLAVVEPHEPAAAGEDPPAPGGAARPAGEVPPPGSGPGDAPRGASREAVKEADA
ncbi:acetyl/propionyl-CoA carboxylase subunit alpha [Streptomyces sp. AJS327]|uniref:acetyl/propionyl/methylcrotonyl-CoA carboxylase subunit alpha n=1 Tax=Streptomyces sp. AJS327 TaxID=2545265 RepID=UPI0015DFECB5|nr:biotin carboxylase N-terminal domain-containing protein [Streptomyces sp. AJS327]MBA0049674.1 acetyl/propionyl-CoA carboxylase subunit alpha [Streptomyces sp. AJS327]